MQQPRPSGRPGVEGDAVEDDRLVGVVPDTPYTDAGLAGIDGQPSMTTSLERSLATTLESEVLDAVAPDAEFFVAVHRRVRRRGCRCRATAPITPTGAARAAPAR